MDIKVFFHYLMFQKGKNTFKKLLTPVGDESKHSTFLSKLLH